MMMITDDWRGHGCGEWFTRCCHCHIFVGCEEEEKEEEEEEEEENEAEEEEEEEEKDINYSDNLTNCTFMKNSTTKTRCV